MFIIIYLLIFITSLFIYYTRRKYSYWRDLGVPYVKPFFPFGNLDNPFKRDKLHNAYLMSKFYNELKGKFQFGGIYMFWNPVPLVTDLDMVRNILVKDFQYFHDRGMYFNEKDDPLSAHLFNIEGEKWVNLRKKLSPTFTSGKMKIMFPTILEVGKHFIACLKKESTVDHIIEMKDILARFTTDVIGSCAFGIDCNSLNDPNTEFRVMGRAVFKNSIKRNLLLSFKQLAKLLRITRNMENVTKFFTGVVRDTINYREKNDIQRNDFMNLLMQLKNSGKLEDSNEDVGKLSLNEIAAQAFVFFLAGFETSSTTMTFCLHELSLNEEIQDRARKCAQEAVKKHGGLTYEAVMDMHYIEYCVNESLRKYPPGSSLIRKATKDYKVPGTDVVIKQGQTILIPVYAIHHDPEVYENPEEYNPDRFAPEEIAKRHSYCFLAFGEGPRNCIGLRFGMLQARIGIAMLLMNFRFKPSVKTLTPLKFSSKEIVLSPEGGLWLTVENLH